MLQHKPLFRVLNGLEPSLVLPKDELLEILSQAKRPQAVQPHLRKCFDNLVKLKFGDGANSTDIHAMISGEGEEIPFYKMLKARNGVEKWLSAEGGVEEYMVKTMRAEVKKGWETYALESDRKEWVRKQYCQVMITVGSIYWTLETEEDLFDNKITSMQNFKWQQQLRYYWDAKLDGDHGDCCIRQVDAFIMYGHEYMGALSRLVITPLTDRCWMTITGALHIKLGAAPAGPAGTGKTESTKVRDAEGVAAWLNCRTCHGTGTANQVPYYDYGALQVEIERGLQKQSLQVHDKLVTKTIQLFETFMVRFGVMLVGPTLGGKSVDYKTLAIALTQLREDNSPDERYQKTKYTCFNPKGITMGELYGENNELTQEWTDGLGSRIMRVLVPRKISTLEAAEFEKFLQPCFCFAFTWTIGGSCDAKTRGPYDGFINFYEGPKWKSWTDIVPKFVFQDGVSYFQLLVPNPDTVRFSYIMDRMMTTQNSVFLTGNSGVGKASGLCRIRSVQVVCMPPTSEEAMSTIFGSIISGFLGRFKSEVQGLANASVQATIDIYNKCGDELLPTPTRPHYTFNLRDVSKARWEVVAIPPWRRGRPAGGCFEDIGILFDLLQIDRGQGAKVLLAKSSGRSSCAKICACMSETSEFNIALTKARVADGVSQIEDFGIDASMLPNELLQVVEQLGMHQLIPGAKLSAADTYRGPVSMLRRAFEATESLGSLTVVLAVMDNSTRIHGKLHPMIAIITVGDCELVVLRRVKGPRGPLELVCHTEMQRIDGHAQTPLQLARVDDRIDPNFNEELTIEVIERGSAVNCVSAYEGDIVIMGSDGVFDNLFLDEILDLANTMLPPECGQSEAKDAVWQFFVESVRENLHIVLTMSPVGSALRVRMRMFPALVNCCTIDWFLPWPDEALLGVSARQLSGMQGISDEVRDSVAKACCFVHQEVIRTSAIFEDRLRRKVYVTPKSYLDLISLYLEMIQEKKDEKDVSLKRLQTGVDKIDEANSFVNNLQEELTKLAPVIAEKIKEADELVKAIADDAQKDLDIAMPALESALKSLDSLDKKDIQEIKSFAKPPPLVMMTMEAVNVLLQEKPDWDTAKKKVLKQLTKYVTKPEYTVEAVGNQSKAAKSLCMWTYAMDTYSKVAKEVEPKKQKVAELNEKLAKANAELQAKQDNLRDVEAQVAALQKTLSNTSRKKMLSRPDHIHTVEGNRTGRLHLLSFPVQRIPKRRETVSTIRQDIINLTGDVFLSAASISYYGPFTGVYRNDIVDAVAGLRQVGDPALEPVLLKAVYEDNNRLQIKLGDSEVDYDKNFLFYMTTKMPNPHYFPEVCIKVTVINFTVTFEGLEEQLLNEVVSKEIPETLQRRVELMLQLADDKKVLKQLEDKILKLLSESSGNILDDQVLISTLGESKETSTAVNQRVKAAEEAAVEIDAACKQYTEVATRGSILYFVIADLANINPMYQFSLFYFVRLFKNCMDKAAKSDDIDIRMTNLSNQILNGIFQNVCRGLFEDNKLTCSFLIATALQRHAGEISPTEWSLLLRGVGLLDMSAKPPNPDTDFFTDKMWDFVYAIQQYSFDRCPDLCEHITENLEDWKDWVAHEQPHLQPMPLNYEELSSLKGAETPGEENSQLHYFHYLLLLKGLAQEKLLVAIQEHTRRCLGEDFIIFPTATVAELYADSTRSTPIVFVLSTGADPTSMRDTERKSRW
eukprot:g25699.t2